MNKQYFVTGIGTGIGKTVVSAILAEALEARYWKPIQAGDLENSDSIKIRSLCSDKVTVLEEAFKLKTALSPHLAAKIDGIKINLSDLKPPSIVGNIVIEGSGGILVPINDDGILFVDYIKSIDFSVILVSKHYLGSINHTLLTIETLKNREINIAGIIFIGEENKESEQIILSISKLKCLARIHFSSTIDSEFIKVQAEKICLNF